MAPWWRDLLLSQTYFVGWESKSYSTIVRFCIPNFVFLLHIYCGRSHLRSRTLGVRTLRLKMVRKRGEKGTSVLKRNAEEYCKSTSLHGFAYWVQAHNAAEKFFWIAFTILSIVCAGLIISSAFRDWRENPGVTRIESFSKVGYEKVSFKTVNLYKLLNC